jgi:UDP-2,3-diacylglucosamine pyrophosphatase LpxH
VHVTADGRRLLVLHGDEFDSVLGCRSLQGFGAGGYGLLLAINRRVQRLRRLFGLPYWSLARHVKDRLRNAVLYMEKFRAACLAAARDAGLDGVVCGHIHRPELVDVDGVLYCNDGDWVESCTALLEDQNGHLTLLSYRDAVATVPATSMREAA